MKKWLVYTLGAVLVAIIAGCAGGSGLSEDDMGIRRSALKDESVGLLSVNYEKQAAGGTQLIERSYDNAPPMIPHDVEGMMDMTADNNMCVTCHAPDVAETMGATPVPTSHRADMRAKNPKKTLKAQINEQRWNCSQCHVPMSDAKPLVGNTFQPVFKNEKSNFKSNLLDVLNEGVR